MATTWRIINGWLYNQLFRSFNLTDDPADGDTLVWDEAVGKFKPAPGSSASGTAPSAATYITQTANSTLSAEQALSALASGILRVATTTGVITSLGDVLPATNGGTGVSSLGTGVATALGVNVGSAGAPVLFNGAGGTPSAITLTNGTGLPLAGVATLAAGVYTPTRSAEVNMDANVTMTEAQYLRVGATVTVSGRFTADPTTTLTPSSFEITLPVASNIGAAEDAAGIAANGTIGEVADIIGVAANDTAKVEWTPVDVTSKVWSYSFTYQVI